MLSCLTACHKTPTTTAINNQKETDSDIIISEQSTLEPEENMIFVTLTEEEIQDTVVAGDNTVTISGAIIKPDRLDGLYQYIANETDYSEYEKNMMFLFGAEEEDTYRDERTGYIFSPNAQLYNSRLSNENSFTGRKGWITFSLDPNPVKEEDRKVTISFEEAKHQADEIMTRIGVKGHKYWETKYYEEVFVYQDPYGDYTLPFGDSLAVYYIQKLQGMPVVSSNSEGYFEPLTFVSFKSMGVDTVTIVEYQYERIRRIDQCISYEQALEGFCKYIAENEEYNSILFSEVSFEYVIYEEHINGSSVLVAKPCWAFKVHEDVFGYEDIFVDAETGEAVERQ